jgi:hypothetical protein
LLVWWAVTLQLRTQFALFLRARRRRRLAPMGAALPARAVEPGQIVLPCAAQPVVSIIIPARGRVEYTLASPRSRRIPPRPPSR